MSRTRASQTEFEDQLARHEGILAKVSRSYAFLEADRQDLRQEIRLQLWRAFPRYDGRRPFSTWMYRIALNVAISWRRHASIHPPTAALTEAEAQPGSEPNPEVLALYSLIDRLEPFDRALLILTLEELSHAEIGEILGTSAANIATKLSRLKARLRELNQANSWNSTN